MVASRLLSPLTMTHVAAALLATIAGLGACTTDEPEPQGDPITSHVGTGSYNMFYVARVDVVFVVDNSPASAALQAQFRVVEQAMLERLATFDNGQLPDVHVGVVTTDLADQGRLRRGRFLADEQRFDEQRHRNYEGAFVETALDLLDVGTTGSSSLRPLAAIQMAVSSTVNPGFRRDDVPIAAIILTSADDADARPIEDIQAALGLDVRISVIRACDTLAPRLDAIGGTTLCDADPARVIEIANQFKTTLEGRCLPGLLLDVDPTTPGLQHECSAMLTDPITGDSRRFFECSAEHPTGCWAPNDIASLPCDPGRNIVFTPPRVQYQARAEIECVVQPEP